MKFYLFEIKISDSNKGIYCWYVNIFEENYLKAFLKLNNYYAPHVLVYVRAVKGEEEAFINKMSKPMEI